jgi:predicted permease
MPDWKSEILARLATLKSGGAWQAEVAEELAQHLDDKFRELRRSGTPEDEARRLTLDELREDGALVRELRTRELQKTLNPPVHRPDWGAPVHGATWRALPPDLRIAFRALLQRPGFSALVIAMLALGIGGNAAIFSIYNGLFLRALPFADSERLVDLDESAPNWNLKTVGISHPDYFAWRDANQSFDGMSAFASSAFNLSGLGQAQRVNAASVTFNLLDVLRLKPALGRNFLPEEDRPGGAKVILLGHDLWQRLFQSDPNILGRVLQLNEEPYTVVGVLPREALFPDQAELWTPLQASPKPIDGKGWYLSGIGRLKAGVTIEQAQADLLRVHKGMIATGAKVNEVTFPKIVSLRERYLGNFRDIGRVLLGGVGIVLLIACVNIAALMMVRGAARSREMAIRTAIGAGRGRIVQQLLTEHAVLALLGGIAGVGLGALLLRGMLSLLPQGIPRWISFPMDLRFALFAVAITAAAAMLFGLAPAVQASSVDARGCMQDAGPRSSLSPARRRWMGGLVVSEIALAMMLLVGAGLLLEAFHKVTRVDPGYRPENVLLFGLELPQIKYPKPEQQVQFFDNLLERLRAVPGVKAAGATSAPPLGGHWGTFWEAEGAPTKDGEKDPVVLLVMATPGYFEALGMTMLGGRTLDEHDGTVKDHYVAVVNQSFARQYWPGQNPVGKRIRGRGGNGPWADVVGLAKDEKHYGLDQEMRPGVFIPLKANGRDSMVIVLRTSVDPASVTAPAREVLRQLDADLPMYGVRTMQERLDRSLWARRAYSWLFGAFAIVALVLAAAGIYGVISYAVSQRTREIGIRMALGAQPGQVLGEVLRSGMLLVGIGLAAGLAGALAAMRLLDSLLFGVSSRDLTIYGLVALAVACVGVLANLLPARRAASIDPIRALRFE